MFKVVADQLKIAQGWVRCGHCSTVFDASAHLVASETVDTAVSPVEQVEPIKPIEPVEPVKPVKPVKPVEPVLDTGSIDEISTDFETRQAQQDALGQSDAEKSQGVPVSAAVPDEHSLPSETPIPDEVLVPPEALEASDAADFDPAAWKLAQQALASPLLQQAAADAPPAQPSEAATPAAISLSELEPELDQSVDVDVDVDVENSNLEREPALALPEPDAEIIPDVSFVRDAQRKAFWQRRLVRVMLALLLLVLSAGLALQWMLQNKDRLAVMEPRLAPVLQALCVPLGCELKLPRQVESLVIDSSTFNKLGIDTYRLDFVIKNTGASLLQVPSLELTLTDSRDQAIVRRVLNPSQFGVSAATLAAHSELAGIVTLKVFMNGQNPSDSASSPSSSAAPLKVAGYRILAFYP